MKAIILCAGIVLSSTYMADLFLVECLKECCKTKTEKHCQQEIMDISVALWLKQGSDDKDIQKILSDIAANKMTKNCPKTVEKFYKEMYGVEYDNKVRKLSDM